MNVIINKEWNYKDMVKNIRQIKDDYNNMLSSFNYVRDKNKYIKATRDNLYSMNLEEFQKDRIWEYMNGYLSSLEIIVFFGFYEKED